MVGVRRTGVGRTIEFAHARGENARRSGGVRSMTTTDDDPRVEALLREAPTRQAEPLTRRDRLAEAGFALALLAMIAALALWAAAPTPAGVPLVARPRRAAGDRAARRRSASATAPPVPRSSPSSRCCCCCTRRWRWRSSSPRRARPRPDDIAAGLTHPDHLLLSSATRGMRSARRVCSPSPRRPRRRSATGRSTRRRSPRQFVADHALRELRMWLALGVPPALQLRLALVPRSIDARSPRSASPRGPRRATRRARRCSRCR